MKRTAKTVHGERVQTLQNILRAFEMVQLFLILIIADIVGNLMSRKQLKI